jgi:hypothetical protein
MHIRLNEVNIMKEEKTKRYAKVDNCCNDGMMRHKFMHHSTCGGIYGLGFIGAVIYYISTATGFWMGVLGFLKAMVWPAFLVFQLLKFLGA